MTLMIISLWLMPHISKPPFKASVEEEAANMRSIRVDLAEKKSTLQSLFIPQPDGR